MWGSVKVSPYHSLNSVYNFWASVFSPVKGGQGALPAKAPGLLVDGM